MTCSTCGKWWCLFACAEVNAELNRIDAELEGGGE